MKMSDIFEKKKKDELDDFWDIDSLIPKKAQRQSPQIVSNDTTTTEISIPMQKNGNEDISSSEFTRFVPPFNKSDEKEPATPELEYAKENSLICNVKVYDLKSKYTFYDRFAEDAKRLWKIKGKKTDLVPFFSYSPQYSQLNKGQLAFYLWWRENARHGVYLDADYSYVVLYLYEIINLSNELDKVYCLDQLCGIWEAYSDQYPFVGKYLCEWVCDFCLIYNVSPPLERMDKAFRHIFRESTLREFYLSCGDATHRVSGKALAEILGAYDFRTGKCATKERLPVMEKHIAGALNATVERFSKKENTFFRISPSMTKSIRNAFTGALCTSSVKKRIEVEYHSLMHSYELRYLVSDIIKYSENHLRKLWKIKSRLSIYALPTEIKQFIDSYFDEALGSHSVRQELGLHVKKSESELAYEKLYSPPKRELSLKNASEIENTSWETTKILVECFEEPKEDEIVSNEPIIKQSLDSQNGLFGDKYEFIKAVLDNDVSKQREFLSKNKILADALVDEINELAADELGDILIDHDGEKYVIIEEYKDIVRGE